MAIKRLGAQRFSGLEADVNNLPIDSDLIGAIFNSTDTLEFWIFDDTLTWNKSAGGSGGITGLEPNSTILEYSTEITDYTTPVAATATSSDTTSISVYDETGGGSSASSSGTVVRIGELIEAGNSAVGTTISQARMSLLKTNSPVATAFLRAYNAAGDLVTTIGTLDTSTLTGSFADYVISGNLHTIVAGDRIILEVAADGTNTVTLQLTASSTQANAQGTFYDGSWTTFANNDANMTMFVLDGFPSDAIDGNTTSFWVSDAGVNESITLDMGGLVNAYGLAYYLSTDAGMTETEFIIKTPDSINATFFDNFSSYADQTAADLAWPTSSITHARVNITTDVIDYNSEGTGGSKAISHDLGAPISDTEFVLRFKINFSVLNDSHSSLFYFGLSSADDSTPSGSAQDSLQIMFNNHTGDEGNNYASSQSDGITNPVVGVAQAITWQTGVDYFFELVRTDGTNFTVRRYDNATFDNVLDSVSDTCPATIVNLQYIKIYNNSLITTGLGFEGTVDDVTFYNNTTVALPNTVGRTVRTVSVADLTLDAYNFIRFNGVNTQKLTIEGSSDSSLVMAANELAVQIESDPPLTTLHGQFTIPTTISTPLNGGDPTSSVIATPQVDYMTLNNQAVDSVSDPSAGQARIYVETVDANNDGVFCNIKVDGTFKKVRVI